MNYEKALEICTDYIKQNPKISFNIVGFCGDSSDNFVFNYDERNEGFMKTYNDYLESLPEETKKIIKLTIMSYVISSRINRDLTLSFNILMNFSFDNAYELEIPHVVYRGIKKYMSTSHMSAYISTTIDLNTASCFAEEDGIILQIILPPKTKVLYNHSEKEFIIVGSIKVNNFIGVTYNDFRNVPIKIYDTIYDI